jgi:hypothetical protein
MAYTALVSRFPIGGRAAEYLNRCPKAVISLPRDLRTLGERNVEDINSMKDVKNGTPAPTCALLGGLRCERCAHDWWHALLR